MTKLRRILFVLCIFTIFVSCASKPKRTMVINSVSVSAGTMIENANACIASGNYSKAENFLDNAYKLAMSVDNANLLTTIYLTKISTYISETPSKISEAYEALEKAKIYAELSEKKEKNLAKCAMAEIRLELNNENESLDFSNMLKTTEETKQIFEKDLFELAQVMCIEGDIYRLKEDYLKAENSYINAIDIFTKECYLSELGITWYKTAQVRSLNNNKAAALAALDNAIKYDRDAENTFGLGTDYYIRGVILMKNNPSMEEKKLAEFAFNHSADIFTAADFPDSAKKSLEKLESYK